MAELGKVSRERLATCHPALVGLCEEVIQFFDFTVLCGHRDEAAQEQAFREGASTKHWPESKHNQNPSLAVDVAPYPVDWNDPARFGRMFGHFERAAAERGMKVRWGGDWNNNSRTKDEKFIDLVHIELVIP